MFFSLSLKLPPLPCSFGTLSITSIAMLKRSIWLSMASCRGVVMPPLAFQEGRKVGGIYAYFSVFPVAPHMKVFMVGPSVG
jgi:hypothetical protein